MTALPEVRLSTTSLVSAENKGIYASLSITTPTVSETYSTHSSGKSLQWICLSCSVTSLSLRRSESIPKQAMPTRSMYWVRDNSRTKTTEKTRDKSGSASATWTCTAGCLAEEDNFQQHYLKGLESCWSLRREILKGSGRERCLSTNFPLGTRVCV